MGPADSVHSELAGKLSRRGTRCICATLSAFTEVSDMDITSNTL